MVRLLAKEAYKSRFAKATRKSIDEMEK